MPMSNDMGRFGNRVESAYCAACGETLGVWLDAKHRECWQCGQTVYDDHDSFVATGEQLGGRFTTEVDR